jgi:hypothetical protein
VSLWSLSFSLSLQVVQPSSSWPTYLLTHNSANHYTLGHLATLKQVPSTMTRRQSEEVPQHCTENIED